MYNPDNTGNFQLNQVIIAAQRIIFPDTLDLPYDITSIMHYKYNQSARRPDLAVLEPVDKMVLFFMKLKCNKLSLSNDIFICRLGKMKMWDPQKHQMNWTIKK